MPKLKRFASEIGKRKLFIYASSGSYYLFMSLVPVSMLLCCILRFTPFHEDFVINLINTYLEASLANVIKPIILTIYRSGAGTLTISIFLTLFSASTSMKALMNGLNAAYDFERKDNFIIFTLKAILYIIFLMFALIMTFAILVYGGKLLTLLQSRFELPGLLNLLLSKLRFLWGILFLTAFFTIMYNLMTAEKLKFRNQLPGALFTSVIWILFSSLFSLYIGVSDKYGAYGMIGTIMVAMMWIYYCFLFLLIGGYINSIFFHEKQYSGFRFSYANKLFH